MTRRPVSIFDAIARARETRLPRSPLHRWLKLHCHEIRKAFAVNGTDWETLLSLMASQGVTDRNGNPPALRTAQQAWYAVDKEARERKARRAPKSDPPPLKPDEVASGVRPVRVQPGSEFGPSLPKNAAVALPPDPAADPVSPTRRLTPEEVQEQIRAVKSSLGGRRRLATKMPAQVK